MSSLRINEICLKTLVIIKVHEFCVIAVTIFLLTLKKQQIYSILKSILTFKGF